MVGSQIHCINHRVELAIKDALKETKFKDINNFCQRRRAFKTLLNVWPSFIMAYEKVISNENTQK